VPVPSPTTRPAPNAPGAEKKLLNRVKWQACSLSLTLTKASDLASKQTDIIADALLATDSDVHDDFRWRFQRLRLPE
jgi:hypothetical protein